MDPFRNAALHNAKLSTLHRSTPVNRGQSSSTSEDMPAPPAYHMVVDPHMPIPHMTSPYDHEEEEDGKEEDDSETPEIIVNAATQIRGHGNIISIAQMDSARIANLVASVLSGEEHKTPDATGNPTATCPSLLSRSSPAPVPITASRECTSRTQVRGSKRYPNINITVNCGATIIGDRNIVGPGLGDIARQMQIAQRNQAALHAREQAAAAAASTHGYKMSSPSMQKRDASVQGSLHGVATPPMSRSSSMHSEPGMKRKVEDDGEGYVKRHC